VQALEQHLLSIVPSGVYLHFRSCHFILLLCPYRESHTDVWIFSPLSYS
jgi:hypothetical protein